MNKNIKVAKQLIKLAKSLVAVKYYNVDDDDSISYLNDDYYQHEDHADRQVQKRHLYDERDDSHDEYYDNKNINLLEDGVYRNFTGQFSYGKKNRLYFAEVQNATFTLKNEKIFWESGTWKDGNWNDGVWEDGIWEDGYWHDGIWESGTWKDGVWNNGTWEDGIWKKGEWYGGYDKDKNQHDEFESPDTWKKDN